MASTSTSASFYTTFQSLKSEINESLNTNDIPKASKLLLDLKTQFRENISSLPAYDERSYDTQIRELESKLSSLRPKTSKFSFTKSKSKSKSTPTTTPPIDHDELSQHHAGPSNSIEKETKDTPDVIRFENLKQSVIRLDPSNNKISSSVILKNLEMCIIDLRPSSSSSSPPSPPLVEENDSKARARITSLHGEGLRYCTLIAPVEGSILLHSLTSCILIISCHQFRMHDSTSCSVHIQVSSMPIIEHCTNIGFGSLPQNNILPPTGEISRDGEVQDFNWLHEGQSPNWRRTSLDEREEQIKGITRAIQDTDSALVSSEVALETPD